MKRLGLVIVLLSLSHANLPPEEARAVAFLSREVPRWKSENDCYSCHNNGDAARALIVAKANGHAVGSALDDTLAWLRQPARWERNKTEGGIDDKPLARVQFAGALRLAVDAGLVERNVLAEAARIVAVDQKTDGSWQLDTSQSTGSPTTYGTALATWAARRTLVASRRDDMKASIAKADTWIRTTQVASVLDAAAVVLALEDATDAEAMTQRRRALETLEQGQAATGGWGPYVTVAPENFDTALVLLALNEMKGRTTLTTDAFSKEQLDTAIARGRSFLLKRQAPDGSWPETTRPSNQESYAQRISTTGWALLAIIATR